MTDQQTNTPNHIGLILDGNRRWARQQGLPSMEGHKRGYENLKTILFHARDVGINYVSAYVFSTENWHRSKEEVTYLMKLLQWVVTHEIDEIDRENGRVVWLGSRQGMTQKVVTAIEKAEARTQHNTGVTLCLCLNHGGHREIAEAVQRLIQNGVKAASVTEDLLAAQLDHPEIPPIDLLIRTSGEQRLSNFMLWRAAYSELMFVDTYWPAFTTSDFDDCLEAYASRMRRFGS